MFVKLFLLGRPGCGKSETARHIVSIIETSGWVTQRFKDYDILERMFREDALQVRFSPTEHQGFDVKDFTVLDEALRILELKVREYIANIEKNAFIVIEFARENYAQAFQQFSRDFLQDAYFLLIDVDLETCRQRISERIKHPLSADDHFVSNYALDNYYVNQYLPENAAIKQRLRKVENQGTWNDFIRVIDPIIDEILRGTKV